MMMDRMYCVLSYTLCRETLHPPPMEQTALVSSFACVCVCSFRLRFALAVVGLRMLHVGHGIVGRLLVSPAGILGTKRNK